MRIDPRLASLLLLSTLFATPACGGGAGIGSGGGPGGGGPGTQTFSSGTPLTIPNMGQASTYPSTITVSGMEGSIAHVTLQLIGVTHTGPADLDIALVTPSGFKIMLLSDAGGSFDVDGLTLTFDDTGVGAPQDAPLTSNAYLPTNYGDTALDSFLPGPPGAPSGLFAFGFFPLNGSSPNGTWRLYVVDDANLDAGSIQGWQLVITTQ